MNRAFFVSGLLLATVVGAAPPDSPSESDENSATGLRLSAGGPSELRPGVRSSDLGITYEETDAVLNLGAGSFAVTRHYTSSDTWKAVWPAPQLFGPLDASDPGKLEWFSSLSSYAVLRYWIGYIGWGGDPVARVEVQVREVSGSLASAEGFDNGGTEDGSGGSRIQLGSRAPFAWKPEESVTLIRPGEGRWEYVRSGDCDESEYQTTCRYKLYRIWRDDYASQPVCTFNYVDGAKVDTVSCFGGVSLHVSWSDEVATDLRVFPTGEDPYEYQPVIQYDYDNRRLKSVVRNDGVTTQYSYEDLNGYQGFTVQTGVKATGLRTVFSKTREEEGSQCVQPWNGVASWYGPKTVGSETTPLGAWVFEGPAVLYPLLCNGISSARSTHDTSGVTVKETHKTVRDGLGNSKIGAGLTTAVERTCRAGVALCTDLADGTAEWNLELIEGEAFSTWSRDFRGAYRIEIADAGAGTLDIPTPLLVGVREGASDSSGADAQRIVDYEWTFYDANDAHEPLLAKSTMQSVLLTSAGTTTNFAYDAQTKQLKSKIVAGYTGDGTGASVQKFVGTFFFPNRICNGVSPPDPMRRPLEVHGPCWVSSASATDCDIDIPGEMMPVTQFSYHPTEYGRRLASKTSFATTSLSMACSGGLTTTYDSYDLEGHVLHETDPSGIVTERVYSNSRLVSETRAGVSTEYLYDEAQGGRASAVKDTAGVWEVFCYRLGGTPADRCTGGLPASELQWKARIAGHPAGSWVVLEQTSYSYSPSPGAIPYAGGGLVSQERSERPGTPARFVAQGFTYDALERLASASAVDSNGVPLFTSQKLLDSQGNLIGEGNAFNAAPVRCGGLDPTATTAQSTLCTRPVYDRLERVEKVTSPGTTPVLTEFEYDTSGNPTLVKRDGRELVQYAYDDFGNVVEVRGEWAEREASRFVYDASGRLVARTWVSLPATDTLSYSYDALGRPLGAFYTVNSITNPTSSPLWLMGYDGAHSAPTNCPLESAPSLKGRLQWKEDSFGITWYEYDSRGLLVAERRTRTGEPECSADELASSSNKTPDTFYSYDSVGRLTETKYPHGLRVRNTWGSAGRQHEVVSMEIRRGSSSPWTPLLSNIVYDVGGSIRSYSLGTSPSVAIEYFRGSPESIPSSNCDTPPSSGSDGSGRITGIKASRGAANVFMRKYGWQADQIVGQATCVLDDVAPVNETFGFDPLLQLTGANRPAGEHAARGGPYEQVNYVYEDTTRAREQSGSDWWLLDYDAAGRLRSQLPRSSSDWKDMSWHRRRFEHDKDGRVTEIDETPVWNGTAEIFQRQILLYPDDGFGSVYRAVMVNAAVYQYLYDAQGRRRLKVYPTGMTDEFFYGGDQLLEDRGLVDPTSDEKYVLDQYVWLGSQPVALVREALDAAFQVSGEPACSRNGESSPCGTFYIIGDYLPKPVAMIDSAGKLAGVGDYDPFGRVNTVSIRRDVAALESSNVNQAPFGHYRASINSALVTFVQPARTASQRVRARVNYAQINTERSADKTWLMNAATGAALTPAYSGVQKALRTPWVPVDSPQGVTVWWTSNATLPKRYGGATTATYEYQRYENGADPVWMPLRFPGQYSDEETGLFENWNRYYDPATGQYIAADPETPSPSYVRGAYVYASHNPISRVDHGGREDFGPEGPDRRAKAAAEIGNRCNSGDKNACSQATVLAAVGAVVAVATVAVPAVAAASAATVVKVGTVTATVGGTQADKVARTLETASTNYEIVDGVRRSVAVFNAGGTTIQGNIQMGDKLIGPVELPISSLFSPKACIEIGTQAQLERYTSVYEAVVKGTPLPPILVQAGSRGTPVQNVTLSLGGQ